MDDKMKRYMRHYYRMWRARNRERVRNNDKLRRERIRRNTDPEECAAVRTLRKSKGMTQIQFGAEVGVSHSLVSKWENGEEHINHEKIREAFPEYKGGRQK